MSARAKAAAASAAVGEAAADRGGTDEGDERAAPSAKPGFGRSTPVGSTLVETLNAMVAESTLTAAQAHRVLASFDEAFPTILRDADQLLLQEGNAKRRRLVEQKIELTGQVANYSQLRDYWKIDVDNVELLTGDRLRRIDHARLLFTTR